jgi:ABC-type Na+ efflux pump permease subunit
MKTILTISKREVTRLRTRFRGRSRIFILLVIVLSLFISYMASQQGFVLSRDFYTVGISPDSPVPSDERFNVVVLDRASGRRMLEERTIDIYLDGINAVYRNDQRSLYAAGALKQFLERQELVRIANEYELNTAFPLRVEVNYLEAPVDGVGTGEGVSLWEIIGSAEASSELTAASETTFETTDTSDMVVTEQLHEFESDSQLPKFKAEFASDKDIIIPSLMSPPIPLAQVIIAFLYVVPIFFVSIFFTSSFMEEKIHRKLNILLSTPATPFQIILGKMLPYIGYAVIGIIVITLLLKGNVLLALAIFVPIMLFILAIYLMVALFYRTFKDQTFFSLLAVSVITVYLVLPAMLSGITDLSSVSPLNLAVQMYKGETFGFTEYLLSTTPMYLVFGMSMFVGVRIFNEEYLMGFRSLCAKLSEAIYLVVNKSHLYMSTFSLSLLLVPAVFMVQLASIVIAFNIPMPFALVALLVMSVLVEELAKSSVIAVLLQNNLIKSLKSVLILSFIAALGFFIGEKLLLYIALSVISESMFTTAIFSTGLLAIPLIAHFVFTSIVCLITARFGIRYYPAAIIAGSVVHALYNLYVIGVIP